SGRSDSSGLWPSARVGGRGLARAGADGARWGMDEPPTSAPLPPGTQLGRYQIVRMLSFGGMGELYLAKTAGLEGFEKEFALKRILAQFASDPSFEHMLLDEARLMASLQHPNIVQVFDIDRVDGLTFFTMEYVHG